MAVLFITGSTGIAAATAELARERGDVVFLAGKGEGADFEVDLADEEGVDRAVKACLERHGRIDGLFNVAGISGRRFGDGPLDECTLSGWETVFLNNARTVFLVSRAVVRLWMASQTGGVILNMASVLAFSPEPAHFAAHAYAASKGAIIALTQSMAAYYAPYGIRVNAIAPGLVRTPMSARAQTSPEIQEFIRGKQPLKGDMLEAAEIARVAVFLLGAEAGQITGQVVTVDGGWTVS